jgi:[ribosomal protein S5]-alanine N-acetyltransferase
MVKLRSWQSDDAAALAQMLNNKNIIANLRDGIPFPYTVSHAKAFLLTTTYPKDVHHFCIDVSKQVAGNISIFLKDDVYRKTAEIGYYIGEQYWQNGIATKAVALATEYAFKHFDVVKLYAEVFEFNKASMRVLEKNNFTLEAVRQKHVIKNERFWNDHIYVKFKPGWL